MFSGRTLHSASLHHSPFIVSSPRISLVSSVSLSSCINKREKNSCSWINFCKYLSLPTWNLSLTYHLSSYTTLHVIHANHSPLATRYQNNNVTGQWSHKAGRIVSATFLYLEYSPTSLFWFLFKYDGVFCLIYGNVCFFFLWFTE